MADLTQAERIELLAERLHDALSISDVDAHEMMGPWHSASHSYRDAIRRVAEAVLVGR